MSDYPQDAFTLWFNCIKDQKKPGEHWAISEIPVESLRALLEWAKTAEKVKNDREQDCVKMRASLRPKVSKAGNDYLLLAISDMKPPQPKADSGFSF
tara:strand:+ start:940 stop:1230 length:291 start_codon:yes stop_codon:yes gene_type:complete